MRRLRLRSGGHRWGSDERGVSLIFITLSMVMLLGFAAFAIDTGALYQERRTLQVGADAGAIAIAEDCARSLPCSQGVADATAGSYADFNADDGDHNVDTVELDAGAGTIRVVTSTATSGGGTLLQPFFAQVLGFGGKNVTAEAKAAWGAPAGLLTLPLIFSKCEFDRPPINGDYNNLDMWDENNPPPPGPAYGETTLFFHAGGAATECNDVAGQDTDMDGKLPGGFGWLNPEGGVCSAQVDESSEVGGDPGADIPLECRNQFLGGGMVGQFVALPWFEDLWAAGAQSRYHVENYVGLYITGYRFPGVVGGSPPPCGGSDHCISGYFYQAVIDGEPSGPPNGGVTVFGFVP